MHYKLLSAVILSMSAVFALPAQTFTEKKTISRAFHITRETSLELNNKYGNIHITPWDKDSVSIKVEIEASAQSLDRLHKIFDDLDVNFSETNYLIRVQTNFTQNINYLLESFKVMTKKIISYESKIEINYFISAPEYIDLNIVNRYGDVYMENNTGNISLNLSNGSFKANILNEASEMELVFCDATINRIKKGTINASFSELIIGESDDLNITSISSRFDFEKSLLLHTESKRDKFYLETAGSLNGDAYFTDFRIENLTGNINLVTKYGNLRARMIEKGSELITINSSYTDIDLTFDPVISYNLDIKYINTFLVVPEDNSSLEKKTIDDDKKEYMTFGTVGKNPGKRKVMIDATRGNIYLK